MPEILQHPCLACPYRKDVASGVWASEEYDKLPRYDVETPEQPFEPFGCHAQPGKLCHGWAVCHSNRGQPNALISLRLVGVYDVPEPSVPLFGSGQEAADHGMKDIRRPGEKAVKTIDALSRSHERLREAN